jgi:hypothetical protein
MGGKDVIGKFLIWQIKPFTETVYYFVWHSFNMLTINAEVVRKHYFTAENKGGVGRFCAWMMKPTHSRCAVAKTEEALLSCGVFWNNSLPNSENCGHKLITIVEALGSLTLVLWWYFELPCDSQVVKAAIVSCLVLIVHLRITALSDNRPSSSN